MITDPELTTIPCRICGEQTPMLHTRLCNGCWEVDSRIEKFIANASDKYLEHINHLLSKRRYVIVDKADQ